MMHKLKARGGTFISENHKFQNFLILYGCRPMMGVLGDTKMIKDMRDILIKRYDRVTFSVQIPACFEDMKGQDNNFEMTASNTL